MLSRNLTTMRQLTFPFMYSKHRAEKYSEEQREEWVRLYLEGKSFRQIAAETGCNHCTISWHIMKVKKIKDSRKTGRRKVHVGMTPKEVSKNYWLKKLYGIDLVEYQRLLDVQGGVCAICGQPPVGGKTSSASLHVDHDHETGRVRGLLCTKCNPAIGQFDDDPKLLEAAAEYLRKKAA